MLRTLTINISATSLRLRIGKDWGQRTISTFQRNLSENLSGWSGRSLKQANRFAEGLVLQHYFDIMA